MQLFRRFLPLLAAALLAGCAVLTPAPQPTPTPSPTPAPTPSPTPAPTATPESALVLATASTNATKAPPQVTDPSTWDDAGKALMERLEQQFADAGMTLTAQQGYPYMLAVNRAASTVTV